MTHSIRLSSTSAACRLEWRPSRLLIGTLFALGMLATAAVLASELPRLAAWPLALVALGHGLWCSRREAARAACLLVVASDGTCRVDGVAVEALQVRWRGVLAFVQWRDGNGRMRRLAFWPDTLPAARRRELRLAASAVMAARPSPSMAP